PVGAGAIFRAISPRRRRTAAPLGMAFSFPGVAMPSAAPPLSISALFLNADFVVQLVMIGLLIASVAVWAIAIDKFVLYSRTKRAMDGFEQAFWSGQSLDELYRSLMSRPSHSMA